MSVINQMLKDLEQRRAQGFDNDAGMLEDLDASVSENNRATSSSKKILWLLLGLLFFVIVGVGFFFSQMWQQKNSASNVVEEQKENTPFVVATPKPAKMATPVTNDIELEETQQVNTPVVVATPKSAKMATPVTNDIELEETQQVNAPIIVATRKSAPVINDIELEEPKQLNIAPVITAQLQQDEIVATIKDEVINKEVIISDISPTPLIATGSREVITVRGNGFVAPLKVTMEWDAGRAFKELETWQTKIISQTEIQLHVNLGSTADEWRMIVEQNNNEKRAEYKFSVVAPAKVELQEIEKKSVFNKKPTQLTKQEKVRLNYIEANYLLQQGDIRKAKDVLQEILLLDANHSQARETLAGLLFREKQYVEASLVLEAGLGLQPDKVSFVLLLAQIYTEQGQDPLAIKMLERIRPEVVGNSDFYALLAALYQRGAKYNEATVIYKKLLDVYPRKAVWWMGLGLSLQAIERKQDAWQAYKNALSAQGLTEELRRFIQSQMQVLQ